MYQSDEATEPERRVQFLLGVRVRQVVECQSAGPVVRPPLRRHLDGGELYEREQPEHRRVEGLQQRRAFPVDPRASAHDATAEPPPRPVVALQHLPETARRGGPAVPTARGLLEVVHRGVVQFYPAQHQRGDVVALRLPAV